MTVEKGGPEKFYISNLAVDAERGCYPKFWVNLPCLGLMNMGWFGGIFSEGEIPCGNIYEILPFETLR